MIVEWTLSFIKPSINKQKNILLILLGKIHEAAQFITEWSSKGGVLKPFDDAGNGQTVKEVLESKHPAQAEANPKAFIDYNQLPGIID